MGSFEQVKVTYSRQSNVNFMHSELLGSMGKIITMTKTEVTSPNATNSHLKKEFGLCAVVKQDNQYDSVKDKAICAITLTGSAIVSPSGANAYNEDDRWSYFIQEGKNWQVSSGNCTNGSNGFVGDFSEDEFNKCVKYIGKTQTDDIFARLSMEPQRLPSFNKIDNSDSIPVDELVFKLHSVISVPRELEVGNIVFSLSKSEKYLWSTEVLDCHICDSGQCKLARFSTASQGTAARHSRICYHSPYKMKEKKDALEIIVEKIPPEFEESGNRIVASTTQQDYSSSCRSNLFRCGNAVDVKDFDPALKFRFLLNYDQPEDSYINKMGLKITDGSDDKEYGTLFVSADQQARVGRTQGGVDSEFVDKDSTTANKHFWPLRAGTNEITSFMADQDSSDSICTDICSGSSPSYYPELTVEYGGSQCDSGNCTESLLSASSLKIACFQCNMKSCHRYGIKTHTGVDSSNNYVARSSEPLDGIVPECLIEDNVSVSADTTLITSGVTDAVNNKCLQTTSGNNLKAVTCTNTSGGGDPVFIQGTTKSACFLEGQTKILEGGYTGGLDARNNCLQVLYEEQLIGQGTDGVWREGILPNIAIAYNILPEGDGTDRGVKEVLEDQEFGGLDPSSGGTYTFNNYARFSTFFGDHTDVTEPDVFVTFQRDASGMFHSGWHRFLGVANSGTTAERERWAFFYREPFNSINFHDVGGLTVLNNNDGSKNTGELPKGTTRKEFLGRARPSRPVYIKMGNDFHADYPGLKQLNDNPPNHYLALIHHLTFKGIRPVKTPAKNNYPYLCRNIKATTYKEAFVITVAEGRDINNGYQNCRNLNPPPPPPPLEPSEDWYFIPPDSRELWVAALQAVAPNALRYPFPNPFNFADGIPFWRERKSGDMGYDAKKRQWELSYSYADMSSDDYLLSEKNDHQFLFKNSVGSPSPKPSGTLARPATAWIGGLAPIALTGGNAGVSWSWKPDWLKILGNSFTLGYDPLEDTALSLLFNDSLTAALIDTLIVELEDDTNFDNIGVLNSNGRVMSFKSLRQPNNLGEFQDKVTKLCRYDENVQQLDFHRALIITGKGTNWPSGNDCSGLSSSNSESFLADDLDSIYFEIPSTPGNSNLKNLAGDDFVEVRQGIRTLIPLLAYKKQGAMHVHNTDKFCRAWKREKKRRAVGNCIIENYNAGTLSKGGVNHGLPVTQTVRTQAVCHPLSKNCDIAPSSFQTQLTTKQAELSTAQSQLATANNNLASATTTCNQICPACVTVPDTAFTSCQQACWSCLSGCSGDPDQAVCESVCRGAMVNCRTSCGCPTPPCGTTTDCSVRDACVASRNAACNSRPGIQVQITSLTDIIDELENNVIPCMQANIGSITKASCMANLDNVNSHATVYSPAFASCPQASALSIDFKISHLGSASDSRCWRLDDLKPKYEFSFNDGTSNLTGRVGVLGDSQALTDWDHDRNCGTASTSLYPLPAACDNYYTDLINLHNNLCNDGIDYGNQTCEHNYTGPL